MCNSCCNKSNQKEHNQDWYKPTAFCAPVCEPCCAPKTHKKRHEHRVYKKKCCDSNWYGGNPCKSCEKPKADPCNRPKKLVFPKCGCGC